jgi:flagellin
MLSINTNSGAIQDLFYLGQAQGELSTSMQRLSSGLRINSAADDPAGLAISAIMQDQAAGLNQAVSNAQTGISLLQTADGALSQSQQIVSQMRTLAVQAANGTLTTNDRAALQAEINQLATQLTNIADQTQFNQQNLLNGTLTDVALQVGANANQTITFSISAMDAKTLGLQTTQATPASGSTAAIDFAGGLAPSGSLLSTSVTYSLHFENTTGAVSGAGLGATATVAVPTTDDLAGGTYTVVLGADSYAYLVNSAGNTVAKSSVQVAGDAPTTAITFNDLTSNQVDAVITTGDVTLANAPTSGTTTLGTLSLTVTLDLMNGSTTVANVVNPTTAAGVAVTFTDKGSPGVTDLVLYTGGGGLAIANGQSIGNLNLSLGGPNVLDANDAQTAIGSLDSAINTVTQQEAQIGAVQNRLQATISELQIGAQNLDSANGVIADANIPQEMINFTEAQVKLQAGVSMLTQANAIPSLLLKIITG